MLLYYSRVREKKIPPLTFSLSVVLARLVFTWIAFFHVSAAQISVFTLACAQLQCRADKNDFPPTDFLIIHFFHTLLVSSNFLQVIKSKSGFPTGIYCHLQLQQCTKETKVFFQDVIICIFLKVSSLCQVPWQARECKMQDRFVICPHEVVPMGRQIVERKGVSCFAFV